MDRRRVLAKALALAALLATGAATAGTLPETAAPSAGRAFLRAVTALVRVSDPPRAPTTLITGGARG